MFWGGLRKGAAAVSTARSGCIRAGNAPSTAGIPSYSFALRWWVGRCGLFPVLVLVRILVDHLSDLPDELLKHI